MSNDQKPSNAPLIFLIVFGAIGIIMVLEAMGA